MVVDDADVAWGVVHLAVEQHEREAALAQRGGQARVEQRGGEDRAVERAVRQALERHRVVRVRRQHQHPQVGFAQRMVQLVEHLQIERVPEVADDDSDLTCRARCETATALARHVVQSLRRLDHLLRVASDSRGSPRSARETVGCDTPAARATSWLVTWREDMALRITADPAWKRATRTLDATDVRYTAMGGRKRGGREGEREGREGGCIPDAGTAEPGDRGGRRGGEGRKRAPGGQGL